MKKLIFIIFIFLSMIPIISYGTEGEILESQKEALDIGAFLSESKKYTEDILPEGEAENFLELAIARKNQ